MAHRLILFNGRWGRDNRQHIYIAAYSKADAARILNEIEPFSWRAWLYEINKYFSVGCWGNRMDGIVPQRGAWVTKGNPTESNPIKIA